MKNRKKDPDSSFLKVERDKKNPDKRDQRTKPAQSATNADDRGQARRRGKETEATDRASRGRWKEMQEEAKQRAIRGRKGHKASGRSFNAARKKVTYCKNTD